MKFRRINETTINCIISQEDMFERGIRLDDFFERKREAMDYLRRVIVEAARQENFNLEGEYTSMRVTVLPDHSLSLTLSEGAGAMETKSIVEEALRALGKMAAENKEKKKSGEGSIPVLDSNDPSLLESDPGKMIEIHADSSDTEAASDTEHSSDGKQQEEESVFGYVFYAMKDVIDCCSRISGRGGLISSLYADEEAGEYYLFLKRRGKGDGSADAGKNADFERTTLSVNEFARFMNDGQEHIAYIREHKKCLIGEDAVDLLAALA